MRSLPSRLCVLAAVVVVLVAAAGGGIARAQVGATSAPPVAAQGVPNGTAMPTALDPAETRRLLELLTDERKRAAFVADLQALSKATVPAAPPAASVAAPATSPAASPAPASAGSAGSAAASGPAGAKPGAPAAPTPGKPPASAAPAGAPTAAAGASHAGASAVEKPAAAEVLPLAPDSVGAQVLVGVSDFLSNARVEAVAAFGAWRSVPALLGWLRDMANSDYLQDLLWRTAWRLAAVAAMGLLAQYALLRLLARPLAAVRRRAVARGPDAQEVVAHPTTADESDDEELAADAFGTHRQAPARLGGSAGNPVADRAEPQLSQPLPTGPAAPPVRKSHASPLAVLRRLPRAVAQLLLELLPVVGFLAIVHLAIGSTLGGTRGIQLVLIALVDAYGLCRALMCVLRLFISPRAPALRLLPLSDAAALYVERWTRRLIALVTFGYAASETGLLFGLPWHGRQALLKTVALAGHVCVGIIILQCQRPVRRWLKPPSGARGVVALLRRRLAASWQWMALFFDAAFWIIWAIEIPNGYAWIWRISIGTAVVLVIARLVVWAVLGAIDQALRVKPDSVPRYPDLQDRLRLYRPMLRLALFVSVGVLTVFSLLQSWGIGALTWLVAAPLGHRVLSAMVTLGATLLTALAVWEAINFGFNRELDRLSRQAQLARLGRLRTLLPMLRTALLITLSVVVGAMVLSEIGVNIAPLLAGAGVLGIAIGFGSQKLVQDVITGLFLLLENTMQVGDVVALGGLSGVVENLSIRTIRLRAEDGSVHVIPFSAVTTVTNQTRDFSHAVIEVSIGYRDDYDRAVQVMSDIVTGMRAEPRWMTEIRDDLEVWGINKFSDSGVMIKCRIRCGPFARWTVGREFNRRVRSAFESAGIYLARQGWADDPSLPAGGAGAPPAGPAASPGGDKAAASAFGAAAVLEAQAATPAHPT